jgi:two-component system, NarL family, nitrate/nitrite response regulator NarL
VALRCLIVDDNGSFLEAAAGLLQRQGVSVVGVAKTVDEAIAQAAELQPEVVLVDIMLGPESGFELARRLADPGHRRPAVIMISTHAEADFADLIDDAPVLGFIPKSELSASAIQQLLEAA